MFGVQGHTIQLSVGDTGLIHFLARGVELTDRDRAVFTVRQRDGEMVLQKVAVPQGNDVWIPFVNTDTEKLCAGTYLWDIRYVLEAQKDGKGMVTDGREIITPFMPGRMHVIKVVGSI